jgi:hypothetical protein
VTRSRPGRPFLYLFIGPLGLAPGSGKAYAFVGKGVAVAAVFREIDSPMPAMEVVRRWSRNMPPAQALQVLH